MTPGETTANVSLEKVRADLQERARVPGLIVEGLPRSPALPLDGRNRRARPGEAVPAR
jgi:hypothetical protein